MVVGYFKEFWLCIVSFVNGFVIREKKYLKSYKNRWCFRCGLDIFSYRIKFVCYLELFC